jgi:FkbM family methyltransferase
MCYPSESTLLVAPMTPERSVSAASEVASILAALLDDPIVTVDVGCRWGFADMWERLGDRCRAIGFEPDEDECRLLRRRYQDRPGVEIVPRALGSEAGPATLYITREPACSSLYAPLDDIIDRHPRLESQRLASREQIELIRLDDWCQQQGVNVVDFIKLDTQGSELDVLRGAVRTLERVLVVQTEVEFNRMYAAQPLFGDVDRFLRDQGFVLWHLENLCHHRQRGARSGLRQSAELFDFDAARFSRRSGQLFWADAVFVRSDVATPRPTTGWREALRRACVTAALGLDELAGLTLDMQHRALEGETRETVEAARALLPETDHETEWLTSLVGQRAPAQTATNDPRPNGMLDEDLVVDLGEPIDGAGWREPHRFGSTLGRWTGPGRRSWIDVPRVVPPGSRVELMIVAAFDWHGHGTIALEVNGVPLDVEQRRVEDGLLVTGRVRSDYTSDRRFTRISILTPEPMPRHETPDPRKIGLGVTELRVRMP